MEDLRTRRPQPTILTHASAWPNVARAQEEEGFLATAAFRASAPRCLARGRTWRARCQSVSVSGPGSWTCPGYRRRGSVRAEATIFAIHPGRDTGGHRGRLPRAAGSRRGDRGERMAGHRRPGERRLAGSGVHSWAMDRVGQRPLSKASSTWNATAHAPPQASTPGSPSGCSPWPPRSGTTGPPAHRPSGRQSPTTTEPIQNHSIRRRRRLTVTERIPSAGAFPLPGAGS